MPPCPGWPGDDPTAAAAVLQPASWRWSAARWPLALDPPEVARADVVIGGGRIAAVGPAPQAWRAGTARAPCIIPGNVCAHHHLYSALARGMPYGWRRPGTSCRSCSGSGGGSTGPSTSQPSGLSALRGGLDALLAGTTTIVDHHASPNAIDGSLDIIAAALEELGLRSVLCYEVTDRDGPRPGRRGDRGEPPGS